MQIHTSDLNSYESQRIDSIIGKSKCFFLLQLYNLTTTEIDTFRHQVSLLGLRLIRFPQVHWRKTSAPLLRAVHHFPVQISNYVLLKEKELDLPALKIVTQLIQQEGVILIFGYQEKIWFNHKRLLESPELNNSYQQTAIETIQGAYQISSPISPLSQVIHQLLQSLEFITSQLK